MVGEQTSNFFLDFWPSGGPSRPWEYFAGTRIDILHPYMVSNLDLKPWQASGGSFTRNMVPSIGTSDPWLAWLALAWPGLPLSLERPCQQQQQPARLRRAARRFAPPLLFLLLPRPSQGNSSQASQPHREPNREPNGNPIGFPIGFPRA